MRYVNLEKTQLSVSALGIGTMRFPLVDGTSILDEDAAIAVIRYALQAGINYIDTAFTYHNGDSEIVVGKAIKGFQRDKIVLTTKCPVWEIHSPNDFERILESQLKKLDIDYLDCYLFHALESERWERIKKLGLLEKAEKAKSKGLIRHIGFSFHDNLLTLLKIINEYNAWEICQLQYNYVDTNKQAGTEGVRYAKEKGLDVIVMEPLHGGRLVNPPEQVANILKHSKSPIEWAFDFLFDNSNIDVVLSGMSSIEEIDRNICYSDSAFRNMLNDIEHEMFLEAKRIYDSMSKVMCTSCGYCMPCERQLNIPIIMAAYNKSGSTNYRNAKLDYDKILPNASDCIACKKCENKCPQKIEISKEMKHIEETFKKTLPDLDLESLKIKWPTRYKKYLVDNKK